MTIFGDFNKTYVNALGIFFDSLDTLQYATRFNPDFRVNFDSQFRDFSLILNDFIFSFRPLLHYCFHKSGNGLPDLSQSCQHQLLQFSQAISSF